MSTTESAWLADVQRWADGVLEETSLPDAIRPRVLAAVDGYRWGRPTTDRDRAVWATCQRLSAALTAQDAEGAVRLVGELERLTRRSEG